MKDELISGMYKSNESSSYRFFLESKKIQEAYWQKYIEEFDRLINQNNKKNEEEHKSFIKVKEIVESETFQYLLDNDKYREKVDIIFSRDNLVIGKSNIKLLKIYHDILALCDKYMKEYEDFVVKLRKRMGADLIKVDTDSKNIFESVFDLNVCTESFFNTLCNNKLI